MLLSYQIEKITLQKEILSIELLRQATEKKVGVKTEIIVGITSVVKRDCIVCREQ